MSTWYLAWLITTLTAVAAPAPVGPVLDPIAGEVVQASDREVLPAARHLGDLADMWFVALTNMQVSAGGLELFDPTALSAHGVSWAHLHTRLGTLDITDPARAGQALVQIPYDAWDTLTWRSLWTDRPGFSYTLLRPDAPDKAPQDVRLKLRYGGDVGGGHWFPAGVFDRDPGYSSGAPTERRALRGAYEAALVANTVLWSGPLRIVVEGLAHEHHYLTLADADNAQRLSVVLAHRMPRVAGGAEVTLVWQGQQRDYEGAQFRWPEAYTRRTRAQGVVGQASLRLPWSADASLILAVGAGWRQDTERPRSTAGRVYDITEQWTWMARPPLAEDMQRFRVDAQALWAWRQSLELRLTGNVSGISTTSRFGDGRVGEVVGAAPVRQTVWSQASSQWWWQSWRAESVYRPSWSFARVEGVLAMEVLAVQDTQALAVDAWTPAMGLSARRALGNAGSSGEIFALARREPLPPDSMLLRFLNTGGVQGSTYAWEGASAAAVTDGAPGSLLTRHGGEVHTLADGVLRPTSNQVALGYRTPAFGPFQFVIQAAGRWLASRYTVAPGEDGSYVLVNDDKLAFFTGTEFQLYTLPGRPWFLNLGGAAYITAGRAPFGSFFDRNDPGVIDESSAGPNAQSHAFGRYDQDRSFTLKAMAGGRPMRNLSIAVAARYRDGEPFTQVVVAPTAAGPDVFMVQPRGRVRHTFAMTWDVRVRYDLVLAPYVVTLGLDVYNFWGSATEILEDPRSTAAYRSSLEAVPDRALLVSVELGRIG